MAEQMILKMQLIASVHKTLLENVEQAQRRQRKVYVARKRLQTFEGFTENAKVKMRRPRKKRSLLSNWEGPYFFVDYKDGKGFQEQIMAIKCVFSKISMDNVGNGQGGICKCICLQSNT
jgi:hypothetical protein